MHIGILALCQPTKERYSQSGSCQSMPPGGESRLSTLETTKREKRMSPGDRLRRVGVEPIDGFNTEYGYFPLALMTHIGFEPAMVGQP